MFSTDVHFYMYAHSYKYTHHPKASRIFGHNYVASLFRLQIFSFNLNVIFQLNCIFNHKKQQLHFAYDKFFGEFFDIWKLLKLLARLYVFAGNESRNNLTIRGLLNTPHLEEFSISALQNWDKLHFPRERRALSCKILDEISCSWKLFSLPP